ncbi:hypothetical protein SeLEV6574_g07330 [Synchytrium endobioticum]|uniref:Uncharacterized protein n=1 Tax=Synchytrium endobioticum TaxID=286115 RepID=A0A507CLE1_9FUNG|nr:hypothetical protein SeLEV6574_g07330 [Synchytrium endobioticum]
MSKAIADVKRLELLLVATALASCTKAKKSASSSIAQLSIQGRHISSRYRKSYTTPRLISHARCSSQSVISARTSTHNNFSTTAIAPALFSSSSATSWPQAISRAEHLVHPEGGSVINPRELLGKDLALVTENIRRLLGSGHPVLDTISNYYFSHKGKQFRPLVVLLVSMATSTAPKRLTAGTASTICDSSQLHQSEQVDMIDTPLAKVTAHMQPPVKPNPAAPGITPSQRRLAEITEMIHTASLLHDDVIDVAEFRRNCPSANAAYGNKMAVLAGDFLLARASVALARLRNCQVVELLATVIANLVEGEFMQLRNSHSDKTDKQKSTFEYYMEKTYMKTASLIAKSCRAAAVLGTCAPEIQDAAYAYGKNLGLAFQLVDDLLDFTATSEAMGKPANADLKLGLATAPVLYAAEEYRELWPLIKRQFGLPGDAELALKLVHQSMGIKRTRSLAASYCQYAIDAISELPPSSAQLALIQLTQAVLTRKR